jgi:alanyl-tRNA synthetase
MLYYSYEGNFLMECNAEIMQCVFIDSQDDGGTSDNDNNSSNNNDKYKPTTVQLVLDRTVLHAQGGGQPTDRGIIQCGDTVINVTKVLLDRTTNVATHTGTINPPHPVAIMMTPMTQQQ